MLNKCLPVRHQLLLPCSRQIGIHGGSHTSVNQTRKQHPGRPESVVRLMPAVIRADAMGLAANQPVEGRVLTVHYLRRDGSFDGWGLHAWHEVDHPTDWTAPLQPSSVQGQESTFSVQLIPDHQKNGYSHWIGLLVHKGDEKDSGGEIQEVPSDVSEVWMVSGRKELLYSQPDMAALHVGDLRKAYAHWVSNGIIAWRVDTHSGGQPNTFELHWSMAGKLAATGQGIQGGDGSRQLQLAGELPREVLRKFPHLAGCAALRVPGEAFDQVDGLLTAQLAVAARTSGGEPLSSTGIQLPGVLDELFLYDGPLGAQVTEQAVALRLWAPTAQKVELLLFDGPAGSGLGQRHGMSCQRGVWSLQGLADWEWKYYQYAVTVFCPDTQTVQELLTTDPYSRSLAADGLRTQIVRMDAPETLPGGWQGHQSPPQEHVADTSIYELHIRDFSITDPTVPQPHRGKYLAFTHSDSAGCRHLRDLQQAGLSHVHLLPSYDIGSVPERAEDQKGVEEDLSQYPMDGEQQQAAVLAIADEDGFNWGYDPVHYGAPEGSYATDPDGHARVLEFRRMVQALHGLGLRVVLDVVYNHTFAAGQRSRCSVLDKVVPGYYHRRMENGDVCMSTCCNNTASEHAMCERLIVDDITHWAQDYKVDGFRFDIMGHHMVRNMERIRQALGQERLRPERPELYLYGEAWDFGEVSCNQRGRNASQLNIGGMGIGSFNDRFRDALMGGSPFANPQFQGWVNGLATRPNSFMQAEMSSEEQTEQLLEYTDLLKVGMAGNLKAYTITDRQGQQVQGRQLMYGQQPAGYTQQPWECVSYADCHDGETLFDQTIMKAAEACNLDQRALINQLATSVTCLSQGTAFFHAGSDILRSKSLDRDSYNSGDHFNRLDWSYASNNFGVGLPPASKNKDAWPLKRPRLLPKLRPGREAILAAKEAFLRMLRIRYSSPLFRLTSADAIQRQMAFGNNGPDQVPGVIEFVLTSSDQLDSAAGGVQDEQWSRVLVVLNSRPGSVERQLSSGLAGLHLHPLQADLPQGRRPQAQASTVVVPPICAAVFVQPRRR